MWDTLEDFAAILTLWQWMRQRQDKRISSKKNGDETSLRMSTITRWTKQYGMTDEHLNFGTRFTSRDEYCKDLDLYGKARGREDGKEDNVATPEVPQHGGDVNPYFSTQATAVTRQHERRTCEALLRASRIARRPSIARGD
jgi:hypothetical protein